MVGQFDEGPRLNRSTGASWNVVKHNWQIGGIGNSGEVLHDPGL